jgi:hypothetical protein
LGASDTGVSTTSLRADNRRRKLTLRKSDIAALQDQSRLPSRRSSTASIKSIFAPMSHDPNSIYINRSMISGRLQVDHELQDVASQVCLEARLQARVQAEVLFPQPSQQRSGFSRSNSAISVAGLARNRLSKQESLRVPRRKPRCDSMTALEAQSLPDVPALPLLARRSGKTLSLQALPPRMMPADQIHLLSASSTSTSAASFYTSPATSPLYACNSPLSRPSSRMSLGRGGSKLAFVRSMKDLFNLSGQSSPQSPQDLPSDDAGAEKRPTLLRRFTLRKTSFRRRSRSVAPDEELPVPN